MSKTRDLSFESIGGLQEHIQTLKEMIIYPLLYRELFDLYGIQAPRGVLFYGPPGTGKTLMAGAVAAECSKCCSRNVSFYMRKGGECLDKYVGESEKHLQNLFAQAYTTRPSIIFFDEIDGLVPTRSEAQEQVHASVVTTLLALMDGLDTKSEVFVIGATNRIDMIDPALRRPGRFDRELYFPLPDLESRFEILRIHTNNWTQKPSEKLLLKLAAECSGYCGADIQSLCSQAVMKSFNRSFPEVGDTSRKQPISFGSIHVNDDDFWEAKRKIIPAIQRIYPTPASPLRLELEPLLKKSLDDVLNKVNQLCPFCFMYRNNIESSRNQILSCPRFLLIGKVGQAHISHIAPAVLHFFDHLPVVVADLTAINEVNNRSSDSSSFVQKIEEVRQNMPSILYLRNITAWWNLIDESARQVLCSSIEGLDTSRDCQILIFGSASVYSYDYLPADVKQMFPKKKCFEIVGPTAQEKKNFFRQVIVEKNLLPPKPVEPVKKNPPEPDDFLGKAPDEHTVVSRLRNGKAFKPLYDDMRSPPVKKPRLAVSYDPCSSAGAGGNAGGKNVKKLEVKVDINKLEKLTDSAVKATTKAGIKSLIRLYEELEIVSLRYASKKDRTSLPQFAVSDIVPFIFILGKYYSVAASCTIWPNCSLTLFAVKCHRPLGRMFRVRSTGSVSHLNIGVDSKLEDYLLYFLQCLASWGRFHIQKRVHKNLRSTGIINYIDKYCVNPGERKKKAIVASK